MKQDDPAIASTSDSDSAEALSSDPLGELEDKIRKGLDQLSVRLELSYSSERLICDRAVKSMVKSSLTSSFRTFKQLFRSPRHAAGVAELARW